MTSSDHNLARLAEHSFEMRGDYPALLFEEEWHTSGELFDRASRIATGLTELGVASGDRVVVTMANCSEVGITYNAIWRAGAVVTPAMFLLPADALAHIVSDSEATAVITTTEFVDKVREAVQGIDSVRFVASTGEARRRGSSPCRRWSRVRRPARSSHGRTTISQRFCTPAEPRVAQRA